jgi:hypothetical protein
MLVQELGRYVHAFARTAGIEESSTAKDLARLAHGRLAEVLESRAVDSATDEHWFGELAVQLNRAERWAGLEELWYRCGMRIIVTQPEQSFAAFSEMPEKAIREHPGLRFARTYVLSTSIMHRRVAATPGEDINTVVSRLSLQVTELTAQVGPDWRSLRTIDALRARRSELDAASAFARGLSRSPRGAL